MVVEEYKTENGVTIRWHDDAYAGKTEEELNARRKYINIVASRLYYQHLMKTMNENKNDDDTDCR